MFLLKGLELDLAVEGIADHRDLLFDARPPEFAFGVLNRTQTC